VWLDLPLLEERQLLSREQVLRCQRGPGAYLWSAETPYRIESVIQHWSL
jgi:hypothetical protein